MNVPEKLAREIERVTRLRSQYETMLTMPGCNVRPVIAMINLSLNAAQRAAGVDDAQEQIAALVDLQGYTE